MTCIGSFLLAAWINGVALKWADYPLLGYYTDGRDMVATAQAGYICILGEKV